MIAYRRLGVSEYRRIGVFATRYGETALGLMGRGSRTSDAFEQRRRCGSIYHAEEVTDRRAGFKREAFSERWGGREDLLRFRKA